jgi:hypothetical protein
MREVTRDTSRPDADTRGRQVVVRYDGYRPLACAVLRQIAAWGRRGGILDPIPVFGAWWTG